VDTTYEAFWSYAHDDDSRSFGRVSKLAEAIQNEFALTTGDELGMFLDRSSIHWGDAWRTKIDSAVGDAPFFMPIITPSYLKSIECRKELIAFSGHAKSRGIDRLLLPILYIDIPNLAEDSPDEVLALIARTQYLDWRKLRNKKLDSEEHLEAVHEIAEELARRRQEVSVVALHTESRSASDEVEELTATAQAIDEKLPAWMEAVDFDKVAGAQWSAALDVRLDRIDRLHSQRAPQSAVMATFIQLGKELLPIASDRLDKAQTYAKVTIELDPLVNRAIRLLGLHPDQSDLLFSLRDGVNEAWLNIDPTTGGNDFSLPSGMPENRHLNETDLLLGASYTHVMEGNRIVVGWRNALRALDGLPPEYINEEDFIHPLAGR